MANKWKIGVYGSGSSEGDKVAELSAIVGKEIAKNNCIVITGACAGVPYQAAQAARDAGGEVWGFAPAFDYESFAKAEPEGGQTNQDLYSKLFYIPKDFEFIDRHEVCCKYRNVTSTATSDAGIIISGKWGTLNEFTNLVDFEKVIGVLTGTGGIADEIPNLWDKIRKPHKKTKVIFDSDPVELVRKVVEELEK